MPEILRFKDTRELEAFLLKDLKDCVNLGEYKRSEIGLIYDDKVYGPGQFAYDKRALPKGILDRLEASGSRLPGSQKMFGQRRCMTSPRTGYPSSAFTAPKAWILTWSI